MIALMQQPAFKPTPPALQPLPHQRTEQPLNPVLPLQWPTGIQLPFFVILRSVSNSSDNQEDLDNNNNIISKDSSCYASLQDSLCQTGCKRAVLWDPGLLPPKSSTSCRRWSDTIPPFLNSLNSARSFAGMATK